MNADRFKMPIYVAIILRKDNKILLMKRSESVINGGLYAFPGGGVEQLETITTAIIRETDEELGILLDATHLQFVHALHVKGQTNTQYITFFFQALTWQGKPSVMEPDKCDEVAWFDINILPEFMMSSHKQALSLVSKNISFSEFGW